MSNQLIHVTDWLPTLLGAAGLEIDNKVPLDGINQWKALSENLPSTRSRIINTIDEIDGFSSILDNDWKLVNGTNLNGIYDGWLGTHNDEYHNPKYFSDIVNSECGKAFSQFLRNDLDKAEVNRLRSDATIQCPILHNTRPCNASKAPCLFNIIQDPCEYNDLSEKFPDQMEMMVELMNREQFAALPSRIQPSDYRADPTNFNNTWTWWLPDEITREEYINMQTPKLKLKRIKNGMQNHCFRF